MAKNKVRWYDQEKKEWLVARIIFRTEYKGKIKIKTIKK